MIISRQQAYQKRYPKRHRARKLAQRALKSGRIKREPCAVCGDGKAEMHHDDYDQPLVVRFLCRNHHNETHGPQKSAMESFTVTEFGRRTSRVTYAAERAPVEITNRGKRVGVVVSPSKWDAAETALGWYGKWRDEGPMPAIPPLAESTARTEPRCDKCRSWAQQSLHSPHGTCQNPRSDFYADDMLDSSSCGTFEAKAE